MEIPKWRLDTWKKPQLFQKPLALWTNPWVKAYGSCHANIRVILEGQNGPFGLKMNKKII